MADNFNIDNIIKTVKDSVSGLLKDLNIEIPGLNDSKKDDKKPEKKEAEKKEEAKK